MQIVQYILIWFTTQGISAVVSSNGVDVSMDNLKNLLTLAEELGLRDPTLINHLRVTALHGDVDCAAIFLDDDSSVPLQLWDSLSSSEIIECSYPNSIDSFPAIQIGPKLEGISVNEIFPTRIPGGQSSINSENYNSVEGSVLEMTAAELTINGNSISLGQGKDLLCTSDGNKPFETEALEDVEFASKQRNTTGVTVDDVTVLISSCDNCYNSSLLYSLAESDCSAEDQVIIYWVQDAANTEVNKALDLCISLSLKLNLPVIAVVGTYLATSAILFCNY